MGFRRGYQFAATVLAGAVATAVGAPAALADSAPAAFTASAPETRLQYNAPLMVGPSLGYDLVPGLDLPWRFGVRARAFRYTGNWFAAANFDLQPLAALAALAGFTSHVAHVDLGAGYAAPLGRWRLMPVAGLSVDLAGYDFVLGPQGGVMAAYTFAQGPQAYGLFSVTYPAVARGALDQPGFSVVRHPFARLTAGLAWPFAADRALHLELGARMEPGAWTPDLSAYANSAVPPKVGPKTMAVVPFITLGYAFSEP